MFVKYLNEISSLNYFLVKESEICIICIDFDNDIFREFY